LINTRFWKNLILVSAWLGAGVAVAQQDEGPILKPKAKSKPEPTATLLVMCDIACNWKLDGEAKGHIEAGGAAKVKVELGEHAVMAVTDDGLDTAQQLPDVKAAGQKVVSLELTPVRNARLKTEREAREKAVREQQEKERAVPLEGPRNRATGPPPRSRPSLLNPASLNAKAPAVFKAQLTTTAGEFVVEVNRAWAPLGADRFYNLVKYGYFTNASFFRVVPGFVVQFGLNADPAVNKVWHSANIKDDPVTQSNKRGTIVFATAGPNTRTNQFFINYVDNARLNSMGFAPFGTVVEGIDVVDKIFPNYGERPRQDLISDQGDAYIKANFPDMDKIKMARIVPPAASAAIGAKDAPIHAAQE